MNARVLAPRLSIVSEVAARPPAPANVVEITGVKKAYRTGAIETLVLRDVSMRFARGSFNAIVGPSGCGKTTLLSLLGALDTADGGSIRIDGLDLVTATPKQVTEYRRRSIGFVFQFYNLLPSLTALENVESSLEFLPMTASQRRSRAMDYLHRVGLDGSASKFPAQLSGGQQQRVAIARALAREPQLLLADEPTGNLDQDTGERVFECMRSLQREIGITTVMVTHDPALADRADDLVRLCDGRVVEPRPALPRRGLSLSK